MIVQVQKKKEEEEEPNEVAVKVDDIDKVCFSDINVKNNELNNNGVENDELLPDEFSK